MRRVAPDRIIQLGVGDGGVAYGQRRRVGRAAKREVVERIGSRIWVHRPRLAQLRASVQSLPPRTAFPRGTNIQCGGNEVAISDWSEIDATLRALLVDVLGLPTGRVASFDDQTLLFGALPEFDSMAVATLLTGVEERFAVLIEDDDVDAEDFASFGALSAFVRRKVLV